VEERDSPRVVTQRHLAEESVASPAGTDVKPTDPTDPVGMREPYPPSNQGILDRQRRWFQERAKFEARKPGDEGPK